MSSAAFVFRIEVVIVGVQPAWCEICLYHFYKYALKLQIKKYFQQIQQAWYICWPNSPACFTFNSQPL